MERNFSFLDSYRKYFSNMNNNLTVLSMQKGMALWSVLPQILSQSRKNFPYFMYAFYLKAVKKIGPIMFEIKSIPMEYFEDLLFRNTYSKNFQGDIKSCALISMNSLLALSVTNESWIELGRCDLFEEGEHMEGSDDVFLQLDKKDESPYLIQCYAVSSIEKGFVMYVTNEKYFNILKYFNMSVTMGPVYKVNVKKCDADISIKVAKTLILGLIEPGCEVEITDMKMIIDKFFRTPKYLKANDVFQVNMKRMLPGLRLNYYKVDNIYFKVINIFGNEEEASMEGVGFYVSGKYTNINLASKTQGFTPMIYTKYVTVNKRLGYEISLCPEGLEKYYWKLEDLFGTFLNEGKLNFRPMILLTGLKGSGKKTVLNCITKRFGLKLYYVDCFDFVGSDGTALEQRMSAVFQRLRRLTPVVLFMENIELLGRDEQCCENVFAIEIFKNHVEKLFDDNLKYPVIIVASSSQKTVDMIPSIQRLFIQTVPFKALKKEELFSILKWLVNEVGMACFPEVLIKVVDKVNGYRFADLSKLIRLTLQFQRQDANLSDEHKLVITEGHWDKGIRILEALYSDSIGTAKVPSVHWEDVGGLDSLREEIKLALEFPKKFPQLVDSGLRVSGFLFYGPPGTGKTLMAKAVATEFNYNFLSVKGPELMNMYVGQSEKNVRDVFQRARDAAPCVIFFDELDSLAPNRGRSAGVVTDRMVSQLLAEMDGLESNKGIFVIGATNRPDLIDPALLRPGRFDKMFYVGVCDTDESKYSVLKALTRRFSFGDDVELRQIVQYLPPVVTGADLYSICSNAWLEAARKSIFNINSGGKLKLPIIVNFADLKHALSIFVPSLTPNVIQKYDTYRMKESNVNT